MKSIVVSVTRGSIQYIHRKCPDGLGEAVFRTTRPIVEPIVVSVVITIRGCGVVKPVLSIRPRDIDERFAEKPMYNNPTKTPMQQSLSPFSMRILSVNFPKHLQDTKSAKPIAPARQQAGSKTHQIHRPNDRHRVRQKMAPTNLIKAP